MTTDCSDFGAHGNYFRIRTCLALPLTTTTSSWSRMAPLAAPEPMNATTSHSKLRVSVTLPNDSVVAGGHVTGKMEVECKSDKLGIGIIMVELLALQGALVIRLFDAASISDYRR